MVQRRAAHMMRTCQCGQRAQCTTESAALRALQVQIDTAWVGTEGAFAKLPGHYYTDPPLFRQYMDSGMDSDSQIDPYTSLARRGRTHMPVCDGLPANTSTAAYLRKALGGYGFANRPNEAGGDWKALLDPTLDKGKDGNAGLDV